MRRLHNRFQQKYERLKRAKRYGKNWDQIRKFVYKRDGYRCRACGKSHCKLNAHHIILLRIIQSNDPRVLITLCDECHSELEKKGIKILQNGGHKNDVVRMTARYLIEKKTKKKEEKLNS
jgi:5-methylcytosine-specific restriction endonuclease McrA